MEPGDVFADTYRIEAEVARGGMGVVYRAVDLGLDRAVALKVMSATLSGDESYRARFRREAAMAARIDHPNVVPVFHRGEADGVMYVVMRLVEGQDLAQVLERDVKLEPARVSRLITQVAGGLDAAHELGLVHRDVKPANILLQGHDRALLTDFGLAKQAVGGEDLTSANTLLGTAAYLAPEQAKGQALDGSCDVYALACVAYHCLSGRTPYPEGPALTVASAHVYDPVPDLGLVAPELPQGVVDAVTRGLAKDPADRWPTAGAFAAALEQALVPVVALAPTQVVPVVDTEEPEVTGGRARWWWALGAAVVVAAGAVGVLLSGGGSHGTATAHMSPKPTPDRHAALIARLPVAVYTGCTAAPSREVRGVVTAVDCSSVATGAADVLVSDYGSAQAVAADFATHYGQRLPDGKCSQQTEVRSTWEQGKLACYANTSHAAVLLYEYDAKGIQVLAVRGDGNAQALYAWWHSISDIPLTG